ncbi:hypothetical protein B9T31_07495 [Acinetobacter sp. ANC 4558]|uniref:DegT/DnrJ/EryC1/StrS family aminotransferase n=1 Tax=Acinetobacter sp. ANC 4558 TaxID=1977876 RepID=UPI000A32C5C2|nr:DegT/DnrJ/EryC1/StrS family aminotransferase [Acinetobacter sp. ANC 4558]OTG86335.1 hypothetical protein B9T31_07495 [Acinetobacter sp. ANC 4558]
MRSELPPTAGLALNFKDFFAHKNHVLELQIAEILNIPKPAKTCSGTVAFILSLQVLNDLQPTKKQVIVPAWTCPLVVLAIEKIGFTPIICDLAPDSLLFDEQKLQQAINQHTLAIVVTHYAGLVNSFQNIQLLAQQYNCYIIEDAAQAMGALDQQISVGLRGDIGFFSLAFGKGLTSAEGGLVFSKHADIHQKLHQKAHELPFLKNWEIKRSFELIGYGLFYHPQFLPIFYGHHLRQALKQCDEISAVGDDFDLSDIPIHQLGKWRSQVAAKAALRLPKHWMQLNQQAQRRIKQLQQLSYLKVFNENFNTTGTFPFILLLVDHENRCQRILNDLWQSGLGITKLFVRSIPNYPNLNHLNIGTPNAQLFAARSFSISNTLWMTDEHFEIILNILKKHDDTF